MMDIQLYKLDVAEVVTQRRLDHVEVHRRPMEDTRETEADEDQKVVQNGGDAVFPVWRGSTKC